jgi:hypothetical protein
MLSSRLFCLRFRAQNIIVPALRSFIKGRVFTNVNGVLFRNTQQKREAIIMPDEIIITPKSESAPAAGQKNQTVSLGRTQLINLCAAGLGVSFFLPWAHFFGAELSGFDLQKMGDEQRLLWSIPVFCVITIVAGAIKSSQKIAGRLAGALPFIVGIYWYYKIGSDLTHLLAYGAYLSLIFGAALFVLPRKAN